MKRAHCLILISFAFQQISSVSAAEIGKDWIGIGEPEWSERTGHASIVFGDKIWVIGGFENWQGYMNSVWYSQNGVDWHSAAISAPWAARANHSAVVFDGKMWVIGGKSQEGNLADVWFSPNGMDWTQATASPGWTARNSHASVVFDNKIWVLGGNSGFKLSDVWYSPDGAKWYQAGSVPWAARSGHASVVFDNKIWVIGGATKDTDVWYSSNGSNWYQASNAIPWLERGEYASATHDGRIWLMGGMKPPVVGVPPIYRNDVWFSSNGADWTQSTSSASWTGRSDHEAVSFNNRLWVLGGSISGGYTNSVWYSGDILPTPTPTFTPTPLPPTPTNTPTLTRTPTKTRTPTPTRTATTPSLQNHPPSQPQGHIVLAYGLDVPSTDPDGDSITYAYRWTSDSGDLVLHGPTPATSDIMAEWQLVQTGETWTVTVTPSDGKTNGQPATGKVKIIDADTGAVKWMLYK